MVDVHIFTSCALNYIPKAKILLRSIKAIHPDWHFHLALGDLVPDSINVDDQEFESIVAIDQLSIPDWRKWAFCHSIVELCTAIKPFMFAHLCDKYPNTKIFYFDPDTVAFSRLDDLVEILDTHNLVLTPHQTDPEVSLSAVRDNEISSLKHGVFNLGFLGVRDNPESRRFVAWWCDRLYHFCVDNIGQGLFTDQRWMDLAPCLFDSVAISRSPRHNVATWNLTTRTFTHDGSNYFINGTPLGFYHFTGFDSGAHATMMLKLQTDNAKLVGKLLGWYRERVAEGLSDPLTQAKWAFSAFSDGTPIGVEQRLVYRLRADLWRHFTDPFEAAGYLTWWKGQGAQEFPLLLDDKTRREAYLNLKQQLPAGFPDDGAGVGSRVAALLKTSFSSLEAFKAASSRVLEVLKDGGVSGVLAKLR